jgi:hypothetical protein
MDANVKFLNMSFCIQSQFVISDFRVWNSDQLQSCAVFMKYNVVCNSAQINLQQYKQTHFHFQ